MSTLKANRNVQINLYDTDTLLFRFSGRSKVTVDKMKPSKGPIGYALDTIPVNYQSVSITTTTTTTNLE